MSREEGIGLRCSQSGHLLTNALASKFNSHVSARDLRAYTGAIASLGVITNPVVPEGLGPFLSQLKP